MAAADLAAVLRSRFPKADATLEADLAACEEASWGETIAPREALKLIQKLHAHLDELTAAARPGAASAISASINSSDNHSNQQERAS
jgi:hypothetical protein